MFFPFFFGSTTTLELNTLTDKILGCYIGFNFLPSFGVRCLELQTGFEGPSENNFVLGMCLTLGSFWFQDCYLVFWVEMSMSVCNSDFKQNHQNEVLEGRRLRSELKQTFYEKERKTTLGIKLPKVGHNSSPVAFQTSFRSETAMFLCLISIVKDFGLDLAWML